ncbi:arylamine N-acetyltransferase [Streptomyces abikoensis]|uniref:arylamine N-acetyltransferase family protein n=2 Tax=Streptomyces abikoensis TaxID=97398 RepID=UPI0037208C33
MRCSPRVGDNGVMHAADIDAYLRHIDATRPAAPTLEALRDLQFRHLVAVPFENLSIHLGEEIVLEGGALVDKVVRRRRGGYCYELNGAFAELLTALGYRVTLLAARVMGPDGTFGIPFDHLALLVGVEGGQGEEWLVDVGFGRNSHHPLSFTERGDQLDAGGVFRIAETEEGDLDVSKDGAVQYRLERRPRALADFEAGNWWHRTSPLSPFGQSVLCSRLTEDGGRVTISGRTLVTTDAGGRVERTLAEGEVAAAYREHFGLELERVPEVRGAGQGS